MGWIVLNVLPVTSAFAPMPIVNFAPVGIGRHVLGIGIGIMLI